MEFKQGRSSVHQSGTRHSSSMHADVSQLSNIYIPLWEFKLELSSDGRLEKAPAFPLTDPLLMSPNQLI